MWISDGTSSQQHTTHIYTFPRDQRDPEALQSPGWSRFEALLRTRVLAAISHAMLSFSQDWSGYS